MEEYVVYKHTNKENGKIYIGITKQKPEKRWRNGHGYCAQRFKRAIEKYGWDGFEHEIVCENLTREEANTMERLLIKSYRSTEPSFGYNQALGGEGGGMYNHHHTPEAREKIRIARKINGFTEEHKKHISEAKSGVNHHMAKPVYQYSLDGEFIKKWDYMNEAAKTLNLSRGNISNACLGRRKTCGGFLWTYQYRGEHF